jgi:hypothetical protein
LTGVQLKVEGESKCRSLCTSAKHTGQYLTEGEREAFLKAAEDALREMRAFCRCFAHACCQMSEPKQLAEGMWPDVWQRLKLW